MLCAQVMSKSCACKFLYGTETNREEIEKLDNALDSQTEFKTEIIFYRKYGNRTHWQFLIEPGKKVFFITLQWLRNMS